MSWESIISFWFTELTPEQWWKKDPDLDRQIKERFYDLHQRASVGELFQWRTSPLGRLAEIIILDQFSRNIFRGDSKSFAADPIALVLSQEAIRSGDDQRIDIDKRSFLYMPFMHSESKFIHEQAVKLFSYPGMEGNLNFEILHKNIIDRFGRYPHRNKILNRASTPEEIEFLKEPGSSF